jgi:hypothetical protein
MDPITLFLAEKKALKDREAASHAKRTLRYYSLIEAMLASRQWEYARDFLESVLEWCAQTSYITEGQIAAIEKLRDTKPNESSNRYRKGKPRLDERGSGSR